MPVYQGANAEWTKSMSKLRNAGRRWRPGSRTRYAVLLRGEIGHLHPRDGVVAELLPTQVLIRDAP